MLKKLFSSKARINLLRLFLFNPKEEYYARQIQRITNDAFENIRRELVNLESTGLLRSRVSGKQRYYSVNQRNPLFADLKSIIFKTTGLSDAIKEAIKDKKEIETAFIYGSYAKNSEDIASDIDMFVVGDISSKDFGEIISKFEEDTFREINYVIFSRQDIKERINRKNHFIVNVLKGPKIFLIGGEDDIRKLG